ncbi:MAG: YneF family protein [Acholeplasmataceae bacterium]|nr:YneF family protein [Acholeplasmataceae bacterium]
MELWMVIVFPILILLVGLIVGFFLARLFFKRYLEKNPPVNEQMIRVMTQQMGRTPSERQVRQVMASMNQAKEEPVKATKQRKKKSK